jgi:prepilin-type N-terminal cleavage/methylation domain-containing protein
VSRRRLAAFTMIEISIVVTIIGVIALVAVPRLMVSKKQDDYRKSLQRLESIANASRDLAISSGRTYVLTFDSTNQTLSTAPEDTEEVGSTTAQPNDNEPTAQESRSANLGKGWQLVDNTNRNDQSSDSQLEIRFFADGTAEARDAKFQADDVEVHLTVDSIGAVKVRRGAAEEVTQQEWEAGDLEQRTN